MIKIKIDLEYSESFEDDMIELVKEGESMRTWQYGRLIFNNGNGLISSQYDYELEQKYYELEDRWNNVKNMDKSVKFLQDEYVYLINNVKKYYLTHRNCDEIKYNTHAIKFCYNELFEDYKKWLLNEMITCAKSEKSEWRIMLNLLKYKQ